MIKQKQTKGFTLIELLVVLAIVGILIALAIVGLRAAQSTQRDTARKDIVSQINAILQSYISTNGAAPGSAALFATASTTTSFIQYSNAGCTNGLLVNNSCVGLDGLTTAAANINAQAGACPSSTPTTNTFDMCYQWGSGSAGYTLGTYLESQTGIGTSKNLYMVAS